MMRLPLARTSVNCLCGETHKNAPIALMYHGNRLHPRPKPSSRLRAISELHLGFIGRGLMYLLGCSSYALDACIVELEARNSDGFEKAGIRSLSV
jgi:hypothetical protein